MPTKFLRGHLAFHNRMGDERDYLHRLAVDGQKPKALYIGCSDSRVIPELLTGASAGDLFVVRNIANHVPTLANADCSVGAAIDYAVGVLGVEDVIVCGHTGCGGVRAAVEGVDAIAPGFASLREWVANLVPTVAGVRAAGAQGGELLRRAVEENVLDSIDNLLTYEAIAERFAKGNLGLHGWLYDLESLRLRVYESASTEWIEAGSLVQHSLPPP